MGVALPQSTVGVLALQGAFSNHLSALSSLGVAGRAVRRPVDLEGLQGLILPGGESTTMSMLLDSSELREPIADLLDGGFSSARHLRRTDPSLTAGSRRAR